jgi:rod shape-determining protein MreC
VRYFSSDADIREGDQLVTSGVGGVFPAGLAVGRIDHVERNPASGFARAEAQPASHPERHRHFLVLQVPVGDGLTSSPAATTISSTGLAGATDKTK